MGVNAPGHCSFKTLRTSLSAGVASEGMVSGSLPGVCTSFFLVGAGTGTELVAWLPAWEGSCATTARGCLNIHIFYGSTSVALLLMLGASACH